MNNIILIKHSLSGVRPELPPEEWTLTDEGRRRCVPLAERLSEYSIDRVIASVEPKASETGQIVSDLLNKPFECADGLHEHERTSGDFYDITADFEDAVARFFANPNTLVFGRETAAEAHNRFSEAINGLMERYRDSNLAVVTHGTVLTLFVSDLTKVSPFDFWRELELPSFVVLSPRLDLLEVVERVV